MSKKCKEKVKELQCAIFILVCVLTTVLVYVNRESILEPNRGECFRSTDKNTIAEVRVVTSDNMVYYNYISADYFHPRLVTLSSERSILAFDEAYPTEIDCTTYNLLRKSTLAQNETNRRLKILEESAILPILDKEETDE
jgi:hypothetical protein